METTDGWLLDGRIRYAQPRAGYRTGIEPVLLAASIPARPGERVLEAGTGAGAGLLCLAARVAGLDGVGIELDPDMASLARRNLEANGMGLSVVTADLGLWRADAPFDHAFANPPWHHAASTPSPIARRRLATQAGEMTLEGWIGALCRALRQGGSLTLVVPAAQAAPAAVAYHGAGAGAVTIFPLWPKRGRDAKLVLVQGRRGGAGPDRIAPGLLLHATDGAFTAEANAVFRDGAALVL